MGIGFREGSFKGQRCCSGLGILQVFAPLGAFFLSRACSLPCLSFPICLIPLEALNSWVLAGAQLPPLPSRSPGDSILLTAEAVAKP